MQLVVFATLTLVIAGLAINSKDPLKTLLMAAVFILPWQGGYWIHPLLVDFRFAYVIIVITGLLALARSKGNIRARFFPQFSIPLIGMVVLGFLGTFSAISPPDAKRAILYFSVDLFLFIAIINIVKRPADIYKICLAMAASLAFQGFLGLIQYKFHFFKIGVIDQVQSFMWWRAKGTFFHANHYGMYILLLFPIQFRMLLLNIQKRNQRGMLIFGGICALAALGLFASSNRGSWAGLVFGMILASIYELAKSSMKARRALLRISVPIAIFGFLFFLKWGDEFSRRMFSDDADLQVEGRTAMQFEALALIEQNPLLGVGYGNYKEHIAHEFVHNLYLLIASETGVPSLILFLFVLFGLFRLIWRCVRSKIPEVANLGYGLLAVFLGFLVASIPGPDYYVDHSVQMHFWLICGFAVSLKNVEESIKLKAKKMKKLRMQAQTGRDSSVPLQVKPAKAVHFNHNKTNGESGKQSIGI